MRAAGMPKDLKKAMKKSKKAKADSDESRQALAEEIAAPLLGGMESKNLKIVYDEDYQRLVGIAGREKYEVLDNRAAAGEVWSCRIIPASGSKLGQALPDKMVRKVPAEDAGASEAQVAEATVTESVAVPEAAAPQCEDPRIAEMEAKIADLEARLKEKADKHRDAILRYGRAQNRLKQVEKMEAEIKQKDISIASLKTQVQSLEKKIDNRDIDTLESERDHYRTMLDEKDVEIAKLKEMLALYESGAKETTVNTFLIGFTGIHSNLFSEGRYKVYFSPRQRILRFIPDEDGDVICPNRRVSIPAIRGFTHFEKVRTLSATRDGSDIVISLA